MKFNFPTTVYILFFFFIPNSIALINIPGIPLLSVSRAYIVVWVALFVLFFHKFKIIRTAATSYPFYKPMLIVIMSMILSTATAQNFGASANALISFTLESFLVSLMIWVSYRKPADIIQVFRKSIVIFAALSIYGTLSYFVGINPVMDFISNHFSSESKELIYSYAEIERVGILGRAQSIFSHPIQYGALLVIITYTAYFVYIEEHGLRKYINIGYVLIFILSILCTFSRTPFLFLFVTITIYWCLQNITRKMKIGLALLLFIMIALPFTNESIRELISSIFVEISGGVSDVRGSSMQMRLEQLSSSFLLFREAPITGHGLSTTRELIESGMLPVDLRGAESLFFTLLIDAGIAGISAYIFFYFFILYYFFKQMRRTIQPDIENLSALTISLICGYIIFLLATGPIKTFTFFMIIITLQARFIYLSEHQAQPE